MPKLFLFVALSILINGPLFANPHEKAPAQLILNPPSLQKTSIQQTNFPLTGWFALVKRNQHWELMPTNASLSDNKVTFDQRNALSYLHSPHLQVGSVAAAKINTLDGKLQIYRHRTTKSIEIVFRENGYIISINQHTGDITLNNNEATDVLNLSRDNGKLIWAGDLDKDDKLDLIIESEKEIAKTHCLFLSKEKKHNKIAGKAGCQFYSD